MLAMCGVQLTDRKRVGPDADAEFELRNRSLIGNGKQYAVVWSCVENGK